MQNLDENHLIFENYDENGKLIYRWTMDKINHLGQLVWIMNHFFVNPDYNFEDVLSKEIPTLVKVANDSSHQIWPLDPAVISYFLKNQDLKKYWYQAPAKA